MAEVQQASKEHRRIAVLASSHLVAGNKEIASAEVRIRFKDGTEACDRCRREGFEFPVGGR